MNAWKWNVKVKMEEELRIHPGEPVGGGGRPGEGGIFLSRLQTSPVPHPQLLLQPSHLPRLFLCVWHGSLFSPDL